MPSYQIKRIGLLLVYAFASLILMGRGGALGQTEVQEGLDFYPCYLDRIERAAECLDLKVPLHWDNPEKGEIDLHLAIMRAKGGFSQPDPFLVLAGGPGQAATDYGPFVGRAFDKVNEERDIILVDQRGTGDSTPLNCELGEYNPGHYPRQQITDLVAQCLEELDVDVRYFTGFDIIRDLEFIRKTLGVAQYNIWGGSYGTRLGLLYMRTHPDKIRSAILDGVSPPNSRLFVEAPGAAEKAFRQMVRDCEAQASCRAKFPNLDRNFRDFLARLRQTPETVTRFLPTTGREVEILVNDAWVAEVVRSALYQVSRTAILPLAIERARTGDDYAPLVALELDGAAWATHTMFLGSTLSILCAEEVPRITRAEAEAAGEKSFHRNFYYDFWEAACRPWPTRNVLEGYNEPVTADIPTLLLSGGLDPVTPPSSAEIAARHLPKALHMVAPHAGHNVSTFGCANRILGTFVEDAGFENIDRECLNDPDRMPFFTMPAGPIADHMEQTK